ncbi:MAG: DUF4830 domain-containing protein [Oscillospiraceae bacterium]|nr:DUF4830 domain-containing protein [Oscillospiraceae bacterium]
MKKLENIKNAFLIGVCIVAALLSAFYPFEEKAAQTMGQTSNLYGETNEQRLGFLSSNGISVESEPSEITEVLIPLEFTAVYQKYEALQKVQGFSLEEYKGQKLRRYSYRLADKKDTLAELLVSNGKIVAAALVDLSENGCFEKIIS